MNWTKQTYLSASAFAEQREEKISEILFSFNSHNSAGSRIAQFFCGKGEVSAEVEIMDNEAKTINVFVNDIIAGEFVTQKCAFNIHLNEGINTLELFTDASDNGMLVRIKGIRLERIYNPLKVIGSTEFGEGCLLYTYENGEVFQRLVGANGNISTNKMVGYKYFDSKNYYSENAAVRIVSIGININGEMEYLDGNQVKSLGFADKAVLVEKPKGGIYVFYTANNNLHLINMDQTARMEYFENVLDNVEDIFAATSGSVLLFKRKAKWWSAEMDKGTGGLMINGAEDSINIKINNLNTVNQANSSEGSVYYICRSGNMYKYSDNEKNVLAYCEFYVPFKIGGVMIWSKKMYVYLNGN